MAREFRSRRDTRPPTEFKIYFEVPATEKVEDPEAEGGFIERDIPDEWVEEERVFHYIHRIPADLMLRIQAGNDITNMVASGEQATAIRELFALAVVEHDEFAELLRDKRAVVDGEMLNELVQAIMEDASNRDPQKPSR